MKKKLLVLTLSLALVFTMMPMISFADTNVVNCNGTNYTSIEDAIDYVQNNTNVEEDGYPFLEMTLTNDIVLNDTVEIPRYWIVTIDLNCHSISQSAEGPHLFDVSGTLSLTDYSDDATGQISCDKGSAIYVNNYGKVQLSNIKVCDCKAVNGAAVYVAPKVTEVELVKAEGNLNVQNCQFVGNQATSKGGAIYNLGSATFNNSTTFDGNTADINGSAIYNEGTLKVLNCTFYGESDEPTDYIASEVEYKVLNTIFGQAIESDPEPEEEDVDPAFNAYYALKQKVAEILANLGGKNPSARVGVLVQKYTEKVNKSDSLVEIGVTTAYAQAAIVTERIKSSVQTVLRVIDQIRTLTKIVFQLK